jgi:hypothetical protein
MENDLPATSPVMGSTVTSIEVLEERARFEFRIFESSSISEYLIIIDVNALKLMLSPYSPIPQQWFAG